MYTHIYKNEKKGFLMLDNQILKLTIRRLKFLRPWQGAAQLMEIQVECFEIPDFIYWIKVISSHAVTSCK